jgi:adenylate kinase
LPKRVILITGTPCVGKTSVATLLADKLEALNVNLTDLALDEKLIMGRDKERNSIIIDEKRMKQRIRTIIQKTDKKDVVVDGHYAVNVVPEKLATHVFVLRRNPVELRTLMEQRGFTNRKLHENLDSEILDVCLVDALRVHGEEKTCELNATGKSTQQIVDDIFSILNGRVKCRVGFVDWLGELENKGLLDEFLKT